ncbi:MAG: tRNA (adenosine(37)-N6)-threonylcarbamoyltransferase complex ATPase subunit type 1 TsaE [Saprospiraceae bacterium]
MLANKSFIYGLENMESLATVLLNDFKNYKKWALYGDMGSGKTTLTKKLIKLLGSVDEGSSPTFTIANQYQTGQALIYHLDLYRLHSIQDAFNAGIYEIIQSESYCFIEWPELIEDWIDKDWLKIKILPLGESSRLLQVLG